MTNDQELAEALPALLREHWDLTAAGCAPLGGGMNSATATVQIDGGGFPETRCPATPPVSSD